MVEDKLLIWKLKRGRQDALQRIYEKYRDDLLRIAAGLLRQRSDAENVVHDTFVTFVQQYEQFTLTGSLKGYLITCVANGARNLHRSRSRRSTVSLEACESLSANGKRPDEWIILDEDFRRLTHAMSELPYEQRETIILRLQGGMKFTTIAALQETSVKTVISRYRYGISKLRTLLNSEVQS